MDHNVSILKRCIGEGYDDIVKEKEKIIFLHVVVMVLRGCIRTMTMFMVVIMH